MPGGPPSVGLLKRYNYYFIDLGWLVGIVYYVWFARHTAHVGFVTLFLLFVFGTVLVSTFIGATTATIAGAITRHFTGTFEGSTDFFAIILWPAPLLGFFAAKYVLKLLS